MDDKAKPYLLIEAAELTGRVSKERRSELLDQARSGELAVLVDSRSNASELDINEEVPFATQRFPIGPSCNSCAIATADGIDGTYLVVALDSTFYSLVVTPSDETGPLVQ